VTRRDFKFSIARPSGIIQTKDRLPTRRLSRIEYEFTRCLTLLITDANKEVLDSLAIQLNIPVQTSWRRKPTLCQRKLLMHGKTNGLQAVKPIASNDSVLQLGGSRDIKVDLVVEQSDATANTSAPIYNWQESKAKARRKIILTRNVVTIVVPRAIFQRK